MTTEQPALEVLGLDPRAESLYRQGLDKEVAGGWGQGTLSGSSLGQAAHLSGFERSSIWPGVLCLLGWPWLAKSGQRVDPETGRRKEWVPRTFRTGKWAVSQGYRKEEAKPGLAGSG